MKAKWYQEIEEQMLKDKEEFNKRMNKIWNEWFDKHFNKK